MPPATTSRRGKIARLPAATRQALNLRLLDNQPPARILAWLNALPETIAVCKDFGHQPIKPQNLSEWKAGGYLDWKKDQDRLDHIKTLCEYSIRMAEASGKGSLSESAASIAAGQLLTVIETATGDDLQKFASSIAALRTAEVASLRAQTDRDRLSLSRQQLAQERQKWAWRSAELLLDALQTRLAEAQAIAQSTDDRSTKIQALVSAFFEDPSPPSVICNPPSVPRNPPSVICNPPSVIPDPPAPRRPAPGRSKPKAP